MDTRRTLTLTAGIIGVSLLLSAYAFPQLPETMVSGWTTTGAANDTVPRMPGAVGIPILMTVVLFLFLVIPRIDPLRHNIKKFRGHYNRFIVVMTAYLAVFHTAVITYNLGYAFNPVTALIGATSIVLYYIGTLLPHAKQNWFIGIRTPWTLSNEQVWEDTHQLGSTLFKLFAITPLLTVFNPQHADIIIGAPAVVLALTLVGYSYWRWRGLSD